MDQRSLRGLIVLNAVLLVAVALLSFTPQPADAQLDTFDEEAKAGAWDFVAVPRFEEYLSSIKGGGTVNEALRKDAYRLRIIHEGRDLYMVNCRPCHGTKADGRGPMDRGFGLAPANFVDEGTIGTVTESYAFWRIMKGGPALPGPGTPWDSAMPIWELNLSEEEVWKIIIAEYDTSGTEPRKPEKHGEEEGH